MDVSGDLPQQRVPEHVGAGLSLPVSLSADRGRSVVPLRELRADPDLGMLLLGDVEASQPAGHV